MGKATDHKDSDANVKVILFKSKTLADGSHPLMVRITKDRQRKYIAVGESCFLKHWDEEKNTPRRNHPNRAYIEQVIRTWTTKYASAAADLKQEEKPFTASSVATQLVKVIRKANLFDFIDETVERLIREKRLGTANTMKSIRRTLVRYEEHTNRKSQRKNGLLFTDLTPAYLDDFRVYLVERGLAETSMAVYFRTLRQIYNQAIKRSMVAAKHYPFNEFKVSQFDLRTRKRAISKADIGIIAGLNLETPRQLLAQHLFLFSYYGAGINFIDLAHLTWQDVQRGRLRYERQKTGHLFNFKLADSARSILEYYYPLTGSNMANYVFPILDRQKHLTPIQISNRVHKKIGQVNKDLKELGVLAGIDVPLTTYVARHSFATALKYSGVKTAVISEAMGHQTEGITQTYLASFENELIDEAFDNL
ncbi:tyrosine-type recombinase/integrase [Spirosoma sp. HMF4905]|uniref:Tyrosine-type recombinase/integrase n=1 Tax=Spirosoma arboris TaxID=2682092 RepID=A0A7K1SQ28_9BACT|nr:site-specific integrase [Spirosoma arboris]MVM35877.1 tyrosine-type recombinase/integrase [Spirosoma arboris]